MMKEMMMNQDYSDVTLVTEDKKQIKANISILSACSPVFQDILKKDKNSNAIVYLRGIQFSEIESIMQFIYLGEATIYEERMDELLAVAKSLEIKELCYTETNYEADFEPTQCYPETSTDTLEDQLKMQDQQTIKDSEVDSVKGKFECEQCHKTYSKNSNLKAHQQAVHEGVKYACNQCDYKATKQNHLNVHIQSIHEGIKYPCDQCDYQATKLSSLKVHFQSKHEGVKYACDQCDNLFTRQVSLTVHIQSMHEGVKYDCDQCDYRTAQQGKLRTHIKDKH